MNIEEIGKILNLYLKIVVSTKSFDNYNSFFNIYGESEEPCRRILLLTPYKELEEVNDENPSEKINGYTIKDNNIWIKEYELTTNPNKIDLSAIVIEEEVANNMIREYKSI